MSNSARLTVKQIARELGMTNTHVASLIRRGDIDAVSKPAGPGTWRVTREALDTYVSQLRERDSSHAERRRAKHLRALQDAWADLTDHEVQALRREVPADLFDPLARLANPDATTRSADLDAVSHAYRRRTDAGIEGLALCMPHDLFWAVARMA